ncbi:MAG: hypothetical protein M1834_005094 [Cirrosporium novae-zelandiae]|nr:MAG: hypothetical protein M1834_005094 [Cirrosporium novae-zelandiae]
MSESPSAPLSAFTQLSPVVYLYSPPESTTTSTAVAPKLIILATWLGAYPSHIRKYVTGYQTLYPTTRILLIRSGPANWIYRSTSALRKQAKPAISTILSALDDPNSPQNQQQQQQPQILLHVFSNGGSFETCNLLHTYKEATGKPLTSYVTIFDSCPGRGTMQQGYNAFAAALPPAFYIRIPSIILTCFFLFAVWVTVNVLGVAKNPVDVIREDLNDPELVVKEAKRVYIYSEADQLVGWNDVEGHAREAEDKGFVVEREKFAGSQHVSHVRVEGGVRYWGIVKRLWEETGGVDSREG